MLAQFTSQTKKFSPNIPPEKQLRLRTPLQLLPAKELAIAQRTRRQILFFA
jgi:hypothetical protein